MAKNWGAFYSTLLASIFGQHSSDGYVYSINSGRDHQHQDKKKVDTEKDAFILHRYIERKYQSENHYELP